MRRPHVTIHGHIRTSLTGPVQTCSLCRPYIYQQADGWPSTYCLVIFLCGDIFGFSFFLGCSVEEDNRPLVVTLHYMYFSLILCVVTFIVAVAISLVTRPPKSEQVKFSISIETIPYNSLFVALQSAPITSIHTEVILSSWLDFRGYLFADWLERNYMISLFQLVIVCVH